MDSFMRGVYHAVIDIGTNSCRLVVVERKGDQETTHMRQVRITRIGEGLGLTQGGFVIKPEAMERTMAALAEYKALIAAYPVDRVHLLGTQALREAVNAEVFVAKVKAALGLDLEIISGEQEAFLSYTGAVKGFAYPSPDMPLVLDIGAGSTELFWEEGLEDGGRAIRGASAPVGCLRLLESPASGQEIADMLREGWKGLQMPALGQISADGAVKPGMTRPGAASLGTEAPGPAKPTLVAVGGTATTLGAIHMKMQVYDPDALLGLRMHKAQVEAVLAKLEGMPAEDRLALPGMLPGREDVMPWGIKILLGAMACCQQDEVVICDRDLLYGILYLS